MAYIARVLKTWSPRKPDHMVPFTENVIKKMTGNADFPNPPVPTSDLDAANKKTLTAFANRKNGAQAKSELEAAAMVQNAMLVKMADYVSATANGDVTKILSTGFHVTKNTRNKAVVPQMPAAPKLSCSDGNLYLTTDKVPGADSYCWVVYTGEVNSIQVINSQLNVNNLANTILVPAGTTREVVTGIAAGTKAVVQVLAQNVAGKSNFSSAASMYINC